jgi:hypothetical protein
MPAVPQQSIPGKDLQKSTKYPGAANAPRREVAPKRVFLVLHPLAGAPDWDPGSASTSPSAPDEPRRGGGGQALWRSRFRANLESGSGGEEGAEGTETGVTSSSLLSLFSSAAGRWPPPGGALGPPLQMGVTRKERELKKGGNWASRAIFSR